MISSPPANSERMYVLRSSIVVLSRAAVLILPIAARSWLAIIAVFTSQASAVFGVPGLFGSSPRARSRRSALAAVGLVAVRVVDWI